MKKIQLEQGQALVMIAIALIVLVGILGLVIDGGNAFLDRRRAQNAADSAALAASVTRIRGEADWVAAALTAAANNGYDSDGVKNVVVVYSPPTDGPFAGNVEYIQVIITSHVDTYFAKVIGRSDVTNIVQATARSKPSEVKELLHGLAIVSLAPTSNCSNQKSFWIHGEATLEITGGGVFVNSNNKDCALIQQGNGSIKIRDVSQIVVVGGASIQKPQLLAPGVSIGGIPMNYPPPFFMPDANCAADELAEVSEDGTSMSPGNWDDKFPPEGVTQLEPGVYCLNDGFEVNGNQTLEGHNVTFKIKNGVVRFDGNANIKIDAPDTGDYKGLLIYLPMENNSQVKLNGGAESSFIGTILAPASEILINGNLSATGFQSQIIGYRVEADGNSNVVIVYDNAQNYDAVTMPEVQLSQ
ncbi:MAG TPA: Tad domain-containing protein [Anaerolineales bacterium]|nr:Tad domain-containing protein [Anaerolineales bacterium]